MLIAASALSSALVSAVVSLLLIRRRSVADEDVADVNELAHEVSTLRKQVRRAYMSSVRAAAGDVADTSLAGEAAAPPELKDPPTPPAQADLKARLRAAVFSPRGRGH